MICSPEIKYFIGIEVGIVAGFEISVLLWCKHREMIFFFF